MSVYAVNGKEPVAAWIPSLDTAGNGTTTLTDLVGSNDGTLTNMVAGSDWVANTDNGGVRALDFDGSNDNISIPDQSSHKPAAITVSVWAIRRTTAPGEIVFKQNTRTGRFEAYAILANSGNFQFVVSNAAGTQAIITQSASADVWTHLALTFDQPTMKGYVNGSLVGTLTHDHPIDYGTNPLSIGRSTQSPFFFPFDGLVDDVRIWDSALDSSDISYLYDSGTGRGIVAPTGAPAQNAQHNNLRNIRMAP